MTISTTASSVVAAGNGATTSFNFSFIAGQASDIVVTLTTATSVATVLTQGSQYSLTINAAAAGQIWGIGGTVTYPLSGSPLAVGSYLTIERIVPFTQLTSISNQGDFYPQAVEQAMDTLEMQIQQVEGQNGRALLFNIADTGPFGTLPISSVRAGKILGFDGSGNPGAFTALPAGSVSSAMAPVVEASSLLTAVNLLGVAQIFSGAQFGLIGDNSTNNTAAFAAAIAHCVAQNGALYLPRGIYLTDQINYGSQGFGIPIIGEGRTVVTIKKATSDGNSILLMGSPSATSFTALARITGITFQGIAGNTTACVQMYDVVRSVFQDCAFQGANSGVLSYGGVGNAFRDCIFSTNVIGANFTYFASNAGGGYPNLNLIENGVITGNTSSGVFFDYGRLLTLRGCDIEANGTAANAATGGVVVGGHTGQEVGGGLSRATLIEDCWLEANAGDASLQFNSGFNTVEGCHFVNNPNATNDVHIIGGRYQIMWSESDTAKTANVLEGPGLSVGNLILECSFQSISFGSDTTIVEFGNGITLRGAAVPAVVAVTLPMILTGTATPSSGLATVVFTPAFSAIPIVTTSISNNSPTTMEEVEIFNLTTGGFSARMKSLTSGSSTIGTTNATFSWVAIGAGS